MSSEVRSGDLPFIDAHTVVLPVAQAEAWDRLQDAIRRSWLFGPRAFPRRRADEPRALRLAGSHLFAAYELSFDLAEAIVRSAEASREVRCTSLRATTYARFKPGLGVMYRALVIGSGAHAVLMRRFLNRLSESPPTQTGPRRRTRGRWYEM